MEPLVIGIRPVIALNKVVLPPPFGPTTAMRLFLFTEKLTSSKINVSPISTQHELDIIVLFTNSTSLKFVVLMEVLIRTQNFFYDYIVNEIEFF